ncbi:uncharacterized protein [Rutidosis leptorrhynchoides]|uniref:uncharacterized protein n=1 Tax=Rutidosis leptorrhynchoides TaxID=125765 RepID=UPI003A9992DD
MKEMMKQKMMNRFHKRNSSTSSSVDFKSPQDKLDFKFSSLQALQVPEGWDKLTLSLISVETDKTVNKTGKASVWNGNCRWTESLSESIYISNGDDSKELHQCLYKFIISKASTRSGILGEVTVNLSNYFSSETSLPIALPLKKCDHGTILQVAIQCLTPRPNLRWKNTSSLAEDIISDYSDLDNMSNASDSTNTKNLESSTSNSIMDTSHTRGLGSRETSSSTVRSHHSFDSNDSFGRESPSTNLSEVSSDLIGIPESSVYDSPRSTRSPLNSGKNLLNRRQDSGKVSHNVPASPLRTFNSSEFGLDADPTTPEDVRAEARMWERNARKLKVDLDLSRNETINQTKNLENVTMELSALQKECNSLKDEIKLLKVQLGESELKKQDADNLKVQVQDKNDIQAELEEEIRFQKDLNNNLSLQLNKTQESNLELVSVLQELEENIEQQRIEIESLKRSEQPVGELDNSSKTELELQKFQESKEFESTVLYLEKTLEEKNQTILDCESEWRKTLSLKNEEILKLEAKLAEAVAAPVLKETVSRVIETPIETIDLVEEVKDLREKVLELERDCNELTDENLELLVKLKQANSSDQEEQAVAVEGNFQCVKDDMKLKPKDIYDNIDDSFKENDDKIENLVRQLKSKVEDLSKELQAKTYEVEELKSDYFLKEHEIQSQNYLQKDLETQLSDLQTVNTQLEDSLKVMQKEFNDTNDSHISSNKILEKKLLELESRNQELETHLAELEEDNLDLSGRISGLEPQLRYLTDARESSRLEAEHLESRITKLQSEIVRLENEVETTKVDMRQKVDDMQKRWLEAQEECEYLKKANPKLQSTTENLMEECSSLQKSNAELKSQKLNLHNRCVNLESKLRESEDNFLKLSNNTEDLEEKLSLMLNGIESQEKIFNLELNDLFLKVNEHTDKCVNGESLLNQMYSEKVAEVENLQKNIEHLNLQISATHDERDKMASDAVLEMHVLRADKDKMVKSIAELKEKLRLSEEKVNSFEIEYEKTNLDLKSELDTSKRNHEELVINHEKSMELLENTRSGEEKLKNKIDELSADVKSYEYQILQLTEENSSLKVQLQKIPALQDEMVALKNSLNDVKYENERLEASLQMISGDFQQLKEEKGSLVEKVSSMQKAVVELEDHKRNKIVLEEKVLRLQGDLAASEALGAQDVELKNELGRYKRSNSQLQWKINRLQDEYEKKFEGLEDQKIDTKPDENEVTEVLYQIFCLYSTACRVGNLDPFTYEWVKKKGGLWGNGSNRLEDVEVSTTNKTSRIESLEIALAEALESNEMYKLQLNSLLHEEQRRESDTTRVQLEVKDEANKKEQKLEAELNELQERYLNMSLKYAEVEAQREELVLKLKGSGPARSWVLLRNLVQVSFGYLSDHKEDD